MGGFSSLDELFRDSRWVAALLGAMAAVVLFLLLGGTPQTPRILQAEGVRYLNLLIGMRLFNVVLFGATVYLVHRLALLVFEDETVGLLAAGLTVPTILANHAIIGWTHVPVAFLGVAGYYGYIRFLKEGETWLLYVAAICAAVTFNIRYADAVLFVPLVIDAVYRMYRDSSAANVKRFMLPALLGAVLLIPSFAFHAAAFGNALTTPYHMRPYATGPNQKQNLAVAFDPARLLRTVPAMLFRFDPDMEMLQQDVQDFQYAEYKSSLLQSSPFLVLGFIGMALAWGGGDRESLLLLAGASASLLLLYGSWIFFSGGWTTNMRYLTPLVPFLSLYAARSVTTVTEVDVRSVAAGVLTAVLTFTVGLWLLSPYQPLPARAVMNHVALAAAVGLVAAWLAAYLSDTSAADYIFKAVLSVSVGVGAIMVMFLDNFLLYNGDPATMILHNPAAGGLVTGALALALGIVVFLGADYCVGLRDITW